MRHCYEGRSDASPADRGGMASSGPALARLNAGRAYPALLHATPKPRCRLDADRKALGSAVHGHLGMPLQTAPVAGFLTCFTVRESRSKAMADTSTAASSHSQQASGCTMNKASASFKVGEQR